MVVYTEFHKGRAFEKAYDSDGSGLIAALGSIIAFDHEPCVKRARIGHIRRKAEPSMKI